MFLTQQPYPPRDLIGYGKNRPAGCWQNGTRLAINVVVNYEEGSERSFAMGDGDQEPMTEWGSYAFPADIRNMAMESMYEYGSRVGVWRILEALDDANIPSTFFACALAFEQNPEVAKAVVDNRHEVCSHGYRWEEVFRLTREQEKEHINLAIASFEKTCGKRPVGWYCRYGASIHTRELLTEEGGFLYDSDAYNDDIPFFVDVKGKSQLVLPYTCDVNDIRFWNSPGLIQAEDFFQYMKESFDVLYAESAKGPRMMSIGLHPRMVGRPGRIRALKRFFDYAGQYSDVWFTTRESIALDWMSRQESNYA
ncbi:MULTISPECIES: allantoinase PuuE [Klebsiella]|uniref:allantoinase PuuE n=1 Tax=Klebsiella TaxID=570 RepID=UPI00074242AC|nr:MULTISPECIES: allantoinase PuuE [Klebsiella]MDU5892254.1 allantoinase PuuE [Atopobium minutum]HCQ8039650.1 allantoinase PuuE [Klebsiella quasipneumoniae subsp. quasipneumoniae]HEF8933355.1 allantoinase PuuE [Klebsiella pneumoniae]KSY08458.1 allantoinase [Klebsiella quasipneumoniae]MBG2629098.1 allantoinase PuuE [Klebsiella michiganensis]